MWVYDDAKNFITMIAFKDALYSESRAITFDQVF